MYRILAIVGISIGLIVGAYFYGYKAGGDKQRAASAAKVIEAIAAARKEEQAKQEKVNEQAQIQIDVLSDINSTLNIDLDRLRERPDRRHMPDKPDTICEGANGSDLSGPDAGFLTRESARADKLRASLKTCYAYADTIGAK